MSILEYASSNRRTINALRVLLAFCVLFYHMGVLAGTSFNPIPKLGEISVGIFFGISGFFVSVSATRNRIRDYVLGRIYRIYPAFLGAIVFAALILGPSFYLLENQTLSGYFTTSDRGPLKYVIGNLLMPLQLQAGIHDLFIQTTPYGINRQESIIYGSLWTLPYEVKFYCLLFIFYLIGRNYTLYIFSGLFLFFFWVSIRNAIDPSFNFVVNVNYAGHFNRWLFVFLSGCILGLSASRIKQNSIIRKILAALGALLIFSYFIFPTLHQILELCAYALSPWFILFFLKSSILNRASICDFDISFGVYIFGFAVQQSLAALGWNSNFGLYLTSSILLTFLLAFFSWIFIERPFLNRRRIKLANT